MRLDDLPFIPARNMSGSRPLDQIRMVVWHTPETPDSSSAAEGVARYFRDGPAGVGSTHIVVDNDSAVRCVPDNRICHGASGGDANRTGWHMEVAGYAAQSPTDWADAYSRVTLINAAALAADAGSRFGIPARWLTDAEIRDGVTNGHCTHADITRAHAVRGGHTDPGAGFPRADVMRLVAGRPNSPSPEDIARLLALLAEAARIRQILEGVPMSSFVIGSQEHTVFMAQVEPGTWHLIHAFSPPAGYAVENLCRVAPEAKAVAAKLHPTQPDIECRTNAVHKSPNTVDVYATGSLGERLHWWFAGAWHFEIIADGHGKAV